MLCCEKGNSEMAELLLNSQANPDLQQPTTGFTALMFSCMGGDLDSVLALMNHGANSQIRNTEGMTASDIASANEFPDLCAVLQRMGSPSTATQEEDLEHPDICVMRETVGEVVKRFRAQMAHLPMISLINSDKGVALRIPNEQINHAITLTEQDM
jgi:ankyrin repeat protein